MIKEEVNKLLEKKMDRLTFLKHVGVGVVAITGVSSLVKTLGGFGTSAPSGGQGAGSYGYGASAYGGHAAGGKS